MWNWRTLQVDDIRYWNGKVIIYHLWYLVFPSNNFDKKGGALPPKKHLLGGFCRKGVARGRGFWPWCTYPSLVCPRSLRNLRHAAAAAAENMSLASNLSLSDYVCSLPAVSTPVCTDRTRDRLMSWDVHDRRRHQTLYRRKPPGGVGWRGAMAVAGEKLFVLLTTIASKIFALEQLARTVIKHVHTSSKK